MSREILILRPQPGAEQSASRARALGLDPVIAPIFSIRSLAWSPPDPDRFDALVLTSANSAREAGDAMTAYRHLPFYAIGETTAKAGLEAGLTDPRIGPSDGEALVRLMASQGIASALHLCGQNHKSLSGLGTEISSLPVYSADPARTLPEMAQSALRRGALVLLHSPRAAAIFAGLAGLRNRLRLAVISEKAAIAAGPGWAEVAVASAPRDEALLELAAQLCQTGQATGQSAGA